MIVLGAFKELIKLKGWCPYKKRLRCRERERDQTHECREGRPHEEEGGNFHSQAKVVPFTTLISDFQLPRNIAVV